MGMLSGGIRGFVVPDSLERTLQRAMCQARAIGAGIVATPQQVPDHGSRSAPDVAQRPLGDSGMDESLLIVLRRLASLPHAMRGGCGECAAAGGNEGASATRMAKGRSQPDSLRVQDAAV
jgi:hypothetical protein